MNPRRCFSSSPPPMATKMKVQLSLIVLLISVGFTNGFLGIFMGKGREAEPKCNCPCQHYWVARCAITGFKKKCQSGYNPSSCIHTPIIEPMKVKVTDCQRCVQFQETVLDVQVGEACSPLYDEQCQTEYPGVCATQQQCTQVYTTECRNRYEQQKCVQTPKKVCMDVTKCHRQPKTNCKTIKKSRCRKIPRPVPRQELRTKCLPVDRPQQVSVTDCQGVSPLQLFSAGATSSLVPEVKISPLNAIGLKLAGVKTEEVKEAVVESIGQDNLSAVSQIAQGDIGQGPLTPDQVQAAIASGLVSSQQIQALLEAGSANPTPSLSQSGPKPTLESSLPSSVIASVHPTSTIPADAFTPIVPPSFDSVPIYYAKANPKPETLAKTTAKPEILPKLPEGVTLPPGIDLADLPADIIQGLLSDPPTAKKERQVGVPVSSNSSSKIIQETSEITVDKDWLVLNNRTEISETGIELDGQITSTTLKVIRDGFVVSTVTEREAVDDDQSGSAEGDLDEDEGKKKRRRRKKIRVLE